MDSGSDENPKDTVAFAYAREQPDVCVHTLKAKYLVHSEVLKFFSPWFAASMSETWWDEQWESKSGAASGSLFKYNYYFNTDEDGIHMLDKKSTSSAGRSTSSARQSTLYAECAALGNIFRAFYQKPLVLGNPIDSETLLYLIETAEKYDALEICTWPILGAMLEIENLDKEISLHPARYLLIGYKLKSTLLFRNAFVHVAGQWHVDSFRNDQNHPTFPEPVRKLVEAESARIMEMIISTTRSLFSMESERQTQPTNCKLARASALLAISKAFRTFPKAGDEGSLFNYINDLPEKTGLDIEVKIEAHSGFCNCGDLRGVARAQDKNDFLKNQVKGLLTSAVRAIVKNNTRLKMKLPYLTCAELSDDQMPWLE